MNSIFEKFLFFGYHSLWYIILKIAKVFINKLPFKIQKYFEERKYPQLVWRHSPQKNQKRIWFHAASGEFEYIKPLLRLWKAQHPEDLLFVTYFSTSARSFIQSIPEIDGWAPLPFDLPQPCENFLNALNPEILIIARTDLWPTLLHKMQQKPKILVASTWSEGSKKTSGLGRWMSLWCLNYLNKVCVVSEDDAQWLTNHSPKCNVQVTGDPRFDQVQYRLQQNRTLPLNLKTWVLNSTVLVAGSTWEEDEAVLLPAWKNFSIRNNSQLQKRLLLVPHEASKEHLLNLQNLLRAFNLPFSLWSEVGIENSIETSILIYDQKGWLAELYQLGSMAFIGGSFKKQVHSVMEALGCGLPVLVGPHFKNNREAIDFNQRQFQGIKFVEEVSDIDSLTQFLQLSEDWSTEKRAELSEKIRSDFLQLCGATKKTFQLLQTFRSN